MGPRIIRLSLSFSIYTSVFGLLASVCGRESDVGHRPVGRSDFSQYPMLNSPAPQSGAPEVLVGGKDTPETGVIQQRLQTGVIQGENGKSVALADMLKELEEMPAPAGVVADVFTQLKSALGRQLNTHSQSRRDPAEGWVNFSPGGTAGLKPSVLLEKNKLVSKPPTGPANRVTDLTLLDNLDRTFTLTWTYKNVGDYDQNGVVSISDITPLAKHFQETA